MNTDPLGKYDPPITVSFVVPRNHPDVVPPEGQTPLDNDWLDIYREELGIIADIWWVAADETKQKTDLMIASGQIPDILSFYSPATYEELYEAKMIQPITEVYDTYATPLLRGLLEADGGYAYGLYDRGGDKYALFFFLEPSEDYLMLWVREDWRLNLGLGEPKTLDDMRKMAAAFTHDDPDQNGADDTTGFTFDNTFGFKLDGFFAAYNAYPRLWIRDANNNVISGKEDVPAMKAALTALQDMYKAGEIWQEFITADATQMAERINTNKIGMLFEVWWYPIWPFQTGVNNDPTTDWRCFPIPTENGQPGLTPAKKVIPSWFYVTRAGFEYPEATIKMGNIYAEKYYGESAKDGYPVYEIWKWTSVCVESLTKEMDSYRKIQKALQTGDDSTITTANDKMRWIYAQTAFTGDPADWSATRTWGPGPETSYALLEKILDNKWYMPDEHFGAPTESMINKQEIIDKIFSETIFKIIVGESQVDAYDAMLAQYKALGGDDIAREVQAIYEK